MELIKVYRYENIEGKGPYWGNYDGSLSDMYWEHNKDAYPGWEEEFDEKYRRDYLAGCDSLDSLNKWFDGYEELLKESGYNVASYLIPKESVEHGKSGKQLRFKK